MNSTSLRFPAILLAVCLVISVTAAAAEKPLASPRLIQAVADEVSGEIAFRSTVRISEFDRIQANQGWHDAAVWIKGELEKMGYADALIEGWPSNGSTRYYTYKTPIGWRVKRAELWMTAPRHERLCSFEEIPLTLVKHSGSGHVEAELVDVGPGTGEEAYRGKDVAGKIVLSTGASGGVMREACQKRGAVGVVTYFPPDVRPGYPEMIRYTAFWPGWEERDKLGFGFNVSKNQGAALKRLLDEGQKVVLKADADTEFFETRIETLSASFQGTDQPEREVMITGHLCHPSPSANDNGSGSAGMLEIARALKRLVDTGALSAPRRTIRFLWVPEFAGTVPYIKAHLDRTRNTLAVINCDMIGEDLHKTGGTFNIVATPDSLPSYLNDVVINFTRSIDALNLRSVNGTQHPFVWNREPFSGGSDHYLFNDGALRVPAVMFNHGDTFHHTSLDTPDKVDPSELRRVCAIALGSVYYLANAGRAEAEDTARLVAGNGAGRLAADASDGLAAVVDAGNAAALYGAYSQALNVISHSLAREKQAVLSTASLTPDKEYPSRAAVWAEPLDALALSYKNSAGLVFQAACAALKVKPVPPPLSADEIAWSKVIPMRSQDFVCPLETDYLVEKLGDGVMERIKLREDTAYEAVNFADGRRSVLDIAQAVAAEYGPQRIQDVGGFFTVLAEAGLFSLRK
jgi:Peptidase family M28